MNRFPHYPSPIDLLLAGVLWVILFSCESTDATITHPLPGPGLVTKNMVLIVIDGPRFVDTWGDPTKANIPFFANELAIEGIHYNNFFNEEATYTSAGHTAITTGSYQWMANDGSEFPLEVSIFQKYLEKTGSHPNQAQILTSKSKLQILADCADPSWRGRYNPTIDAQNREDSLTLEKSLTVLENYHPGLTLIHFRGPDYYGHANQWDQYLESIRATDRYTYIIWQFLQNDPLYRGNTTMIVTNDHGRHSDGVRNGFVGHGDFCEGCMHVNLFAAGPDFSTGQVIGKHRELVDIASTVAYMMGFELPASNGDVMWELFK